MSYLGQAWNALKEKLIIGVNLWDTAGSDLVRVQLDPKQKLAAYIKWQARTIAKIII